MNKKNDHGRLTKPTQLQQQFVPDRLRQLRVALGYSTIDFSDNIKVSRQALNQFETNRIIPSYDTMLLIEKVTGFPSSYFHKPFSSANEGPFLFRANRTSLKKTKAFSRFMMLQMQEIYEYFSNYLDFTPVNIPLLEFDISSSLEDIEEIAIEVRKHWGLGLGPISHVYRLLENNGVVLARLNKKLEKVDAFSQWRNGRPFMVVGNEDFTACRLRLNAMHEFGHLLMHTDSEFEDKVNHDPEFNDLVESQAFRFAGAFLLPRESFLNELYSFSLPHLIDLKQRWGVSLAAIVRRCKDLEIISESKYEVLIRQVKKYGRTEPLDDVIEREIPTAFNQSAKLLIDHAVKQRQDILHELRIPGSLVEVLMGVDKGFFKEEVPLSKVVNIRQLDNRQYN